MDLSIWHKQKFACSSEISLERANQVIVSHETDTQIN